MKNVFFYTLLLVVLNSILIVNQSLGINVILFTIPLLVFLYYYLKLNKLIKNKKGLLFFIPIYSIGFNKTFITFSKSPRICLGLSTT